MQPTRQAVLSVQVDKLSVSSQKRPIEGCLLSSQLLLLVDSPGFGISRFRNSLISLVRLDTYKT